MMKLQHPLHALALPLLMGAVALPASAQVLVPALVLDAQAESTAAVAGSRAPSYGEAADSVSDVASGTAASGAWDSLLARRHQAHQLSRRGEWVAAASQWRELLFELQRGERLSPQPERLGLRGKALRQEAEHEIRFAQSHLSSFWRVRNMVTPGTDSRNSTPFAASRPDTPERLALGSEEPGATLRLPATSQPEPHGDPAVLSSALVSLPPSVRPPLKAEHAQAARISWLQVLQSLQAGARPAPGQAAAAQSRQHMAKILGKKTPAPKPDSSRASLRWAEAQWWAGPMVWLGADSRNSTPAYPHSLESRASLAGPRVVLAPSGAYLSSALLKAPGVPAPQATTAPRLPAPLRLPSLPQAHARSAAVPSVTARAGRTWTMQIYLPSASEAARAASRPLSSQP